MSAPRIILFLSLAGVARACTTDADCSYNGVCSSGVCACAGVWSGTACATLTLGTVDKAVYGYREGYPYTTSWGGSAQWDEDTNQYIMLVSEYAAECPNWGHNSAVVLATADEPQGPYAKQFRLFGVMSHEAMLARGPDGDWIVYFTAKKVAATGLPASGTDDDNIHGTLCTRTDRASKCSCPAGDADAGSQDPTWMAFSKTPLDYSSWSTPTLILDPLASFSDVYCVDGSDTCDECDEPAGSIDANFNGVVNTDGSFTGLWRTWECASDLCGDAHEVLGDAVGLDGKQACFSVPHVATASDWSDASAYRVSTATDGSSSAALPAAKRSLGWLFTDQFTQLQASRGIEDPMVYADANGVYHAIFHDMFEICDVAVEGFGCTAPRDNVAHAYSVDGLAWTYTGAARQPFETAAFAAAPPVPPSSRRGNRWLRAALYTPEAPLSDLLSAALALL